MNKNATRTTYSVIIRVIYSLAFLAQPQVALADGPAIATCNIGGQVYECTDKITDPWSVGSRILQAVAHSSGCAVDCAPMEVRSFTSNAKSGEILATFIGNVNSEFPPIWARDDSAPGLCQPVFFSATDTVTMYDQSDQSFDSFTWATDTNTLGFHVDVTPPPGHCLPMPIRVRTGTLNIIRLKPRCPTGFTPSGTGGFPVSSSACLRLPSTCTPDFGNPITADGVKKESETDYDSPNPLFSVSRSYNSTLKLPESTGTSKRSAWRWNFESSLIFGSNNVIAVRPSGARALFPVSAPAVASYSSNYPQLRLVPTGTNWIIYNGSQMEVYDASGVLLSRWISSGQYISIAYAGAGKISTIGDMFGRALTLNYHRADDNLVTNGGFSVNDAYLLQSITTPRGSVILYDILDSDPELRNVSIDGVLQKTYSYNTKHQLASVTDGDASLPYSSFDYGGPGDYAIYTAGPDGTYSTVGAYLSPATTTVTLSGLYGTSNISYVNAAGNMRISGQTQAAGYGCSASSKATVYDSAGNVASSTDFKGNQACYVNDSSRGLEQVRVEGLSSSATCSAVTPPNSNLPSGSRKVTTQWHPNWQMPIAEASSGKIVTSI